MVKTTVYLSDEQHRELRALARRTGKPQAELIREAVAGLLERQPRPKLSFIGIAEDHELTGEESEAWLEAEWDRRP